jgi:hypothetical protein
MRGFAFACIDKFFTPWYNDDSLKLIGEIYENDFEKKGKGHFVAFDACVLCELYDEEEF